MNTHILGFPRMGRRRELKRALEKYWKGKIKADALLKTATALKTTHWQVQADAGLTWVTVGDFSLYDHVLDTLCMLNLIPPRFLDSEGGFNLATYFHMARGDQANNIQAMEMTKWFDTNYHFIVPELVGTPKIQPNASQLLADIHQVTALGMRPKPVLLGPITLFCLAKHDQPHMPWKWFEPLIDAYKSLISALDPHCDWIQLDEPILATDLAPEVVQKALTAWQRLTATVAQSKLMVTSYFAPLAEHVNLVCKAGFQGIHVDMVRAPEDLPQILRQIPAKSSLSLGLVNGRNIWKTDLTTARECVDQVTAEIGADRVLIGSSCSLLHTPVDLIEETSLPASLKKGLAFAVQKCSEVVLLGTKDRDAVALALQQNRDDLASLRSDSAIYRPEVRQRIANLDPTEMKRQSPYEQRRKAQHAWLNLPLLPTTTIGSFPQTATIRSQRKQRAKGKLNESDYQSFLQEEIRQNVAFQEVLGLDVLVHGEPERNDMVEFFSSQLEGICFTQNGWVQSYGSRCVKPPIIYGDVFRPQPMTVSDIVFAQSCTRKPVKAMLTGPVTILCWSFVREDLAREDVCKQLAMAIRDEVTDLEKAGIHVIQIDEAALREGMPIRKKDQGTYLTWAIQAFHLASSSVADQTQIHTHMCYSEFNEIIDRIAEMDADVISIESSRSAMELLDAFKDFAYPNEIGPGVYDIHSPRIPSIEEIVGLLRKALNVIPPERLWVNPDCGLKTRDWPETKASLKNMVMATALLRETINTAGPPT